MEEFITKSEGYMVRVIYVPRGRAREYCEYAIDTWEGCGHGCFYCFAALSSRDAEEFHCKPRPRWEIMPELDKQLGTGNFVCREVQLCFHCDPFMPEERGAGISVVTMNKLLKHECYVRILTKAPKTCIDLAGDLMDEYSSRIKLGTTLTLLKDNRKVEPGAEDPETRLAALHWAHGRGIHTWVSLEPCLQAADSLGIIERSHYYVDEFKIGKWNHTEKFKDHSLVQRGVVEILDTEGWAWYANEAVNLCRKHRVAYKVKEDLWPHVKESKRVWNPKEEQ